MATSAPASASAIAIARPIPRADPVTKAIFPLSGRSGTMSVDLCTRPGPRQHRALGLHTQAPRREDSHGTTLAPATMKAIHAARVRHSSDSRTGLDHTKGGVRFVGGGRSVLAQTIFRSACYFCRGRSTVKTQP